ncbi:MAG: isochorismatase family cysteine hydrolase [Desulfobacteraceae bacterium]
MSRYTAPEWSKSALITIDTQCDALDGQPFEIPGTSAILPRMEALLQGFREAQKPIIHIVRIYEADGSNVDLCRRELIEGGAALVQAGSSGCQLAPELLPRAGIELDSDLLLAGGIQKLSSREVAIYKSRWGAFYNTPLEHYLRELGVSTLVFSGCNYPNCPRTSIYEASERDFRLVLAEDAISGLYEQGRREMHNIGVTLISVDKVTDAIRHATGRG